jgi:Tol biopolymer transport system component
LLTSAPGEAEGVQDFDVSFINNQLAFIAGNQLLLSDIDGSLPVLILDANQINPTTDSISHTLQTVRWSPDGSTLAFSLDGINLYNLSSGSIFNIFPDTQTPLEDTSTPTSTYAPYAWSPDGSRLLVSIIRASESTLGILTIATRDFIELGPGGVCCQAVWLPDSQAVLVANPFIGIASTGLWLFNAQTGVGSELITQHESNNSYNLVGWPIKTPDGWLQYFFTNLPNNPGGEANLTLVRSTLDDVGDRTPLRTDLFIPKEVLWSLDGKIAVMVISMPGSSAWSSSGPIILIRQNDTPIQPLAANGYNLRWGP